MPSNRTIIPTLAALAIGLAACGGSSEDSGASETTSAPTRPPVTASPPTTADPPPTEPPTTNPPTTPPATDPATTPAPPTTAPSAWREEVAAFCTTIFDGVASVAPDDGSAADIVRFVDDLEALLPAQPDLGAIEAPSDVQPMLGDAVTLLEEGRAATTAARDAAASDEVTAAREWLRNAQDSVNRTRGLLALAGATCDSADPDRAQAGALNVPTEGNTYQANVGFGSLWASQTQYGKVTRHDPATGAVVATVDVGYPPPKLQAADGRMIVRTETQYVAIDPATNTVAATLDKVAVGPFANRSFARDGALWICDGTRLHRYDPSTLQPVAVVELGIDCVEVYATDDLVVAYRTDEDELFQSGVAAAAFVDPATNQVLATVPLPVDVGYVAVLDDAVFFPSHGGSTAVVIDRATWTVTATPDLGVATAGGLTATDGARIYVPVSGHRDVVVVDAETFAVVDTIESLGNNAPVLLDGSLWTVDSWDGLMQRHDLN